MEHAPYERLKWRVLRYAGALPSEKRAQEMTDADYLYCLVHEMLDREEAMERLCPECRTTRGGVTVQHLRRKARRNRRRRQREL